MTNPPHPSRFDIVTTRTFDAARERVFHAFANPKELAHWWGPHGFTNTIREFDFRPGGAWRLTMHGPDGAAYDNESRFLAIETPARIVFEHLQPMHWFEMTMTFADAPAGKTVLTWRMSFERTPENEKLRSFLTTANEQNFDRLEAHLRTTAR